MIQKKKKVALVFGITRDYVFALANVLIGLKRHNSKFWDDIIIYHDGVGEHEQKCIKEILPVEFVDLSDISYSKKIEEQKIKTMKEYRVATFYRYECLKLLEKYHQVIWNDVDILIKGDISGLLKYGEEIGIAFSPALPQYVMGSSLKKLISGYNMFAPLWNVGTMVLTDKLTRYKEMYDWCIEMTVKYEKHLLWLDVAIFNLMLQKFKIEPEGIDANKYVCLPGKELTDETVIIHAYECKRFWNNLECMQNYPEWIDNALKWARLAYDAESIPLVSCIMSCYERYDYLVEAVRSILAQSYLNFELIVVLEKSKNQKQIEDILIGFNDKRIRIINNKEKLGFAESLNFGIDKARGEYIARMDDDDIAMPCRFAKEINFLNNHPKVGIVGSDMVVFGREKGYAPTFQNDSFIRAVTLVESPFKHPTIMMRKKVLDENNLRYDPKYFSEDYELWSRLVYLTGVENIPEPLVYYRSHDLQATSSGANSNEAKIHASHKKTMLNQLKKYLDLELSDNEIELLQTRKNYWPYVLDNEGMLIIREQAVGKILEANKTKQVYDEKVLDYILNDREPGKYSEDEVNNTVDENIELEVQNKPKNLIRGMASLLARPFYSRLVSRMETIMIRHDNEVQTKLQCQINDVRRDMHQRDKI